MTFSTSSHLRRACANSWVIEDIISGLVESFGWAVATSLGHHLLELLVLLSLCIPLKGFIDVSYFEYWLRNVTTVLILLLVCIWIKFAFGPRSFSPIFIRGFILLRTDFRHQIEILIAIACDTLSSSIEYFNISSIEDSWMQRKLLIILLLHFSLDHFHPMHITFDVIRMEKNRHDINLVVRWSMVQLLPAFISKLLCHWWDVGLVLGLIRGTFMSKLTLALFLM